MELSFIWVEEFNSLEDFSLNLSNKYQYKYDQKKHFLSRVDDAPLPKNFFGNGITSVTGIFGKNGSGKTNCLKLIGSVMSRARSRVKSDFIAIVESDDGPLIYCKFKGKSRLGPEIDFLGRFEEYKDDIRGLNTVFLSNTFDSSDMGFDKKIINLSINNRGRDVNEFIDIVEFLSSKEVGDGFSIPTEISVVVKPIRTKEIKSIIEDIEHKIGGDNTEKTVFLIEEFERCFNKINRRFRRECHIDDIKLSIVINEIVSTLRESCQKEVNPNFIFENIENMLFCIREHSSSIGELVSSLLSIIDRIDSRYENYNEANAEKEYKPNKISISNLIRNIQSIDDWRSNKLYEIFNVSEISYSAISGFKFKLTTDYYNDEVMYSLSILSKYSKMTFLDMSSGQKAILGILSSIYTQVKRKRNATLIMLDEADLYLHPEWQLLFMKKMIEILSSLNGSDVQIIVTSHSPLIMTDFPKRCLILLESKGKSTLIKGTSFNPFGANLYDLYSQGFFLEESKVGALAVDKIMKLLSELREHEKGRPISEDFKLSLNLISDEVTKNEIKRLIKS
ncbi:AAA family ATPase [Vibrio parahaemolyticus]|uniref:AAA family ATPase n=1 Tax=Vibrio parahaemolyticus TaxID=670 RepID=UPI0023602668|nr:AAA family ATPase [Vibrio parahaemolyticus]